MILSNLLRLEPLIGSGIACLSNSSRPGRQKSFQSSEKVVTKFSWTLNHAKPRGYAGSPLVNGT
jgi:hypothetical protein